MRRLLFVSCLVLFSLILISAGCCRKPCPQGHGYHHQMTDCPKIDGSHDCPKPGAQKP